MRRESPFKRMIIIRLPVNSDELIRRDVWDLDVIRWRLKAGFFPLPTFCNRSRKVTRRKVIVDEISVDRQKEEKKKNYWIRRCASKIRGIRNIYNNPRGLILVEIVARNEETSQRELASLESLDRELNIVLPLFHPLNRITEWKPIKIHQNGF